MKYTNRIVCLGMALSLFISANAFAEITIPPIPVDSINSNETEPASQPGPSSGNQGQEKPGQNLNEGGFQGPSGDTLENQSQGPGVSNSQTGPVPSGNNQSQDTTFPYTTALTNKSAETGSTEIPEIKSASAILYDATNNRILYEKDASARYYPASITKLMTALLVIENTNLTDTVTFADSAVSNLEAGSVGLGLTQGDQVSVKDCLYGMLLKSANEVANGLAEHVAGSVDNFALMMNEKAKALGCTNTHFANPNGLNNSNHYTTAHDMALIAKAAFENQTLCEINHTLSYTFPATKKAAARTITLGHKMFYPTDARYYQGIVGGKTGYTSLAGNTLVTCVDRDGVRLITVILKSKQTHYDDTKKLLDYGFARIASGQSDFRQNQSQGPGASGLSGNGNQWLQDNTGWKFTKEDGSYAQNEGMMIDGSLYWFDSNSYMAVGWRQLYNSWYYFGSSGAMAKQCWIQTEGNWYCVDENGKLYTNTTTPDGYAVDGNGIWRQ